MSFGAKSHGAKFKRNIGMRRTTVSRLLLIATALSGAPVVSAAQSRGVMIQQWGEFGDRPGQFKYPTMIAVDRGGAVYVADQHNHRIQKFSPDGLFLAMWGRQGDGAGEFNYPYGVAVDSRGDVYVSDMNNNRLQKFSAGGAFLGSVGTYGTEAGQMKYPYGIAIDEKDIVYVIDAFNYRIQKFDSSLRPVGTWGSQEQIGFKLYAPHEIAIARDGSVILSDRQNHRISVFSKEGKLLRRFGEFGEGKDAKGGQFSEPHGVAVGAGGEVYVCDRYNFRLQAMTSEGRFLNGWFTSGVFDDSKQFPLGVAVGADGSVYVTDHYAHSVQRYRP